MKLRPSVVLQRQATSDLSASGVLEATERLLSPRARRVFRPAAGSVELALGSRLKYRLIGAAVPSREVPVRLRVDVEPAAQGSRLQLTLSGDEGWYLATTWRHDAACETCFDVLLEDLAQAGILAGVERAT